jgi:hypothetical protein
MTIPMMKRKSIKTLAFLLAAVMPFMIAAAAEKSPTVKKAEENGEKVTTSVVTTTTDVTNFEPANGDSADITVIIPPPKPETTPPPTPEPAKPPEPLYLFPTSVYEETEGGSRQIIKTYTPEDGESPYDISRESFVREGWYYELTDIIKTETASVEAIEHKETVTTGADTKDIEAIIKLLAPNLEFKTEDGFYGFLALDIASVKVETAGTKTSSSEKSVTREYPGLSSSDTSYIPKEITDGGRTYTLANVDWRAQNSVAVDYDAGIAESYTAVAVYTRTATSTTVTGYTVTADYAGTINRMNPGQTIYTAYFLGAKIPPVQLTPVPDDTEETPGGSGTVTPTPDGAEESPTPTQEGGEPSAPPTGAATTATPEMKPPASETEPEKSGGENSPLVITILLIGLVTVGFGVYTLIDKYRKETGASGNQKKSVLANIRSLLNKNKAARNIEADADDYDDVSESEPVFEDDEICDVYTDIGSENDTGGEAGGEDEPEITDAGASDTANAGENAAEPGIGNGARESEAEPGDEKAAAKGERSKRNQRLILEAAYAEKILKNEGVPPDKLKEILTELFRTADARAVLDRFRTEQNE